MKRKVISWHITTDCNINCKICYKPKKNKNGLIEEMLYLKKIGINIKHKLKN